MFAGSATETPVLFASVVVFPKTQMRHDIQNHCKHAACQPPASVEQVCWKHALCVVVAGLLPVVLVAFVMGVVAVAVVFTVVGIAMVVVDVVVKGHCKQPRQNHTLQANSHPPRYVAHTWATHPAVVVVVVVKGHSWHALQNQLAQATFHPPRTLAQTLAVHIPVVVVVVVTVAVVVTVVDVDACVVEVPLVEVAVPPAPCTRV